MFAASPIAIPMQACTQWTHSDVWLQLATTPECLFKIGDQWSEKKRQSEGDMQCDAQYWRWVRSNPPPGCLWRLWQSVSTLTQLFRPDGNVFCWWWTSKNRSHSVGTSATTLVSIRNTWVFWTALMALMEPRTLCQKITHFQSPRQQVRVYWTNVVTFRCTWEHLCALWLTVEQSGKNIFFGDAAGAAGNHSYYLWFNDFQNLCIQFVFSSRNLCLYIATYLRTVYPDWQHAVIESNSRCTWRCRSSELRDTLQGRDRASLEMQLEPEIEWTERWTWRPWLSQFGDALWGSDQASLEMHCEVLIEGVWRCNWRLRLSELRDSLVGRDRASLDIHLEAEIEWTQRCTASWDQASLEMHLQQAMIEGD